MKLFVDDTGAAVIHWHITRAYMAAAAGRVAVFYFTVVDNGHGLEAAMRMLADTEALLGWRKFPRSGVV